MSVRRVLKKWLANQPFLFILGWYVGVAVVGMPVSYFDPATAFGGGIFVSLFIIPLLSWVEE